MKENVVNNMDLSLPRSINSPLSTAGVFGDNVSNLLGTGALQVHPTGIIVVNSINDAVNSSSGVTTLRDAINKANADSGEDLIVFDRSLFSAAQTITLKLGELDITHSLDIIAPRDSLTGSDLVTVSGNNASRVFEIESGATVNLSGLIVESGSVTGDNGGGIKNSGTLNLNSSIIHNNSTARVGGMGGSKGGDGGGIYNIGNLQVSNSTLNGNSATGTASFPLSDGGGVRNDGIMTVSDSIISGNLASNGGGVFNNSSGTLTVKNSTISGNSATGNTFGAGGGIENFSTMAVSDSIISGNSAGGSGGGIFNDPLNSNSIVTVSNSTISRNSATGDGGGIYNLPSNLTLSNSTISDNSARGNGGGIFNDTRSDSIQLTVINSTISGNSATGDGGGIYNQNRATLTLLFSTIAFNQALNSGGIYNAPSLVLSGNVIPPGSTSARNTIIASNLNSVGGVNPNVSGTFTSNGYNLISDSTGSTGFGVTGDIVGTSAKPIDPRLGVLASNGGHTQTIALLPGSPAINAGDPTVLPTDPKTDQRRKPRVQGGRADIGAFESSPIG